MGTSERRLLGEFLPENLNGKLQNVSTRSHQIVVHICKMMWRRVICIYFTAVKLFPFSRHADLNELLDSGKDSHKLEAMRRIIEVGT